MDAWRRSIGFFGGVLAPQTSSTKCSSGTGIVLFPLELDTRRAVEALGTTLAASRFLLVTANFTSAALVTTSASAVFWRLLGIHSFPGHDDCFV